MNLEEDGQDQIHLRDYLRILQHRKWTVIFFSTIIVVTVIINSFTATPMYEATSRLIIDKENPNVVSIKEVMTVDASGTDYYQTQYKIIQSRTVARDVIRRLQLDASEEFFPKQKDNLLSNLKGAIQSAISSVAAAVEDLIRSDEEDPSTGSSEQDSDFGLVSAFIGRIDVRPVRNSRLVDVSFKAKDPVLAAEIANTVARAYIDQNLETKLRAVQDAVRWLNNRIEEERRRVEKSELALLRYKELHNIVTDFTSDVEKITAQKLAQLNAQVVEVESKRVEAETRYRQAIALMGTPDLLDSITEVLNNALIREIKSMEVDLYKRMSELSKKYGRKHPQMVAIESELETLQKRKNQEINRVISSLRNEYEVALARENSLKEAFAKQRKDSLELNQKAIEYGVLRREAESANHMYELLIKRFKETSVTEDMRTGNIRIVDRAEVPVSPIEPKKGRNILLALMVGLFAGVGTAFFFEYLDNTIKGLDDIKEHLRIPYLGPVPIIAAGTDGSQDRKRMPELVTVHSPKSTASEAYRGIRTGILYSLAEREPRVLLVTSAAPREGKTVTATNLAVTLAQSGSKVLLLDCDMRRPQIHQIFGIDRERGVSNLLIGADDSEGLILHSKISDLDVIPCGPIPPNPSEILGSSRMSKLIEALKEKYTHIIIDSPPISAVTDPLVLSKSTDGVILVIRANNTPRAIIKNGVEQLQSIGAHILGAVLNGVDLGSDPYYYYYYYGEDGEAKKTRKKKIFGVLHRNPE